jgi:putative transposase
MNALGIRGISPRKFRRTTIPDPKLENSPNLLKGKEPLTVPNQAWASDITFVPTGQGWLYLCVVIDLWSRKVVGMSMADHMRAELVESALKAALDLRRPKPNLIFHSDCGGQYKATTFRRLLSRKGILQSMTHAGNCYDNATAESFFGTLKTELGKCQFSPRREAESTIFEYIESFYNRTRIHSSPGYLTPDEFERQVA